MTGTNLYMLVVSVIIVPYKPFVLKYMIGDQENKLVA